MKGFGTIAAGCTIVILLGPVMVASSQSFGTQVSVGRALCALDGRVSDEANVSLKGVSVVAEAWDTHARYQMVTDDAGEFEVAGLVPGSYTITARKDGFHPTFEAVTLRELTESYRTVLRRQRTSREQQRIQQRETLAIARLFDDSLLKPQMDARQAVAALQQLVIVRHAQLLSQPTASTAVSSCAAVQDAPTESSINSLEHDLQVIVSLMVRADRDYVSTLHLQSHRRLRNGESVSSFDVQVTPSNVPNASSDQTRTVHVSVGLLRCLWAASWSSIAARVTAFSEFPGGYREVVDRATQLRGTVVTDSDLENGGSENYRKHQDTLEFIWNAQDLLIEASVQYARALAFVLGHEAYHTWFVQPAQGIERENAADAYGVFVSGAVFNDQLVGPIDELVSEMSNNPKDVDVEPGDNPLFGHLGYEILVTAYENAGLSESKSDDYLPFSERKGLMQEFFAHEIETTKVFLKHLDRRAVERIVRDARADLRSETAALIQNLHVLAKQ